MHAHLEELMSLEATSTRDRNRAFKQAAWGSVNAQASGICKCLYHLYETLNSNIVLLVS